MTPTVAIGSAQTAGTAGSSADAIADPAGAAEIAAVTPAGSLEIYSTAASGDWIASPSQG